GLPSLRRLACHLPAGLHRRWESRVRARTDLQVLPCTLRRCTLPFPRALQRHPSEALPHLPPAHPPLRTPRALPLEQHAGHSGRGRDHAAHPQPPPLLPSRHVRRPAAHVPKMDRLCTRRAVARLPARERPPHVGRRKDRVEPRLHPARLAPAPARRAHAALRELTLLGEDRLFLRVQGPGALVPGQNDPSDFEFYAVPAPPADKPPFPALTHLHVVFTGPKLHPWEKTLPRWAAIAPAVTHLRISQGNARVPAVLGEMLGVLPPPAATPTEEGDADPEAIVHGPQPGAELLYPSLRVVVVQLSGARKTNAPQDPERRELERIHDDCSSDFEHSTRLVILRNRAYMPGYWESRLQWEWRERMVGGGGCWTENETDEDAWKVFSLEKQPGAGKRRKGKSEMAVNVRELRDGSSDSQSTVSDARSGKKWWRVLANGIPHVRKRSVA
ncbi:hypothetical protein C8T65DRAFT_768119, partial [Cerioporus squamosus]